MLNLGYIYITYEFTDNLYPAVTEGLSYANGIDLLFG